MYKLEIIQSETLTRQLNQNWQLGDWAVNGYKIVQIKEIKNNIPVAISDGYFSIHSNRFILFPLTLHTKRIVEEVEFHYKKLRDFRALNFPDINRKYEEYARIGCELSFKSFKNEEDCRTQHEKWYKTVSDFTSKIIESVQKNVNIDGVEIFK